MIRLHTLGSVNLTGRDGRPIESVLCRPKRLALLAYLAIARPHGFHRRDKLLALFWPEADGDHARGSLNQAIYVVRRAVGARVLVSRGGEEVGLGDEGFWCDAPALEAALDAGRAEEALVLYRGALLDGFFIPDAPEFERWLDRERERLRARVTDAALRLSEACERSGNLALAAERARWAAELTPTDERALRRLLTVLERAGDRAGALRAYEEFAARLEGEYDLNPSPETTALVAALRRDAPRIEQLLLLPQPAEHEEPAAVAAPAGDTSREPDATVPTTTSRRYPRWVVSVAAAAGLVLLTGYGIWSSVTPSDSGLAVTDTRAGVPSVAVLPFANLNSDAESDYFGEGLADEILTALGRVDGLYVVSRTSSFAFKGKHADVREIGRVLGTRYILEGSVRRTADRLRVMVRLVDVANGYALWTESFDREGSDVFEIQEEISRAIVAALHLRSLVDDRAFGSSGGTRDLEAYNLHLRGRHHFNRRSVGDALNAVGYFEQAIARDSSFARAYAGLADVLALLPYYRAAHAESILPRARAAAVRAIELDGSLPEPHSTLGWIGFTYEWNWPAAEREFEEALRLDPGYTTALHFYSLYLARVAGRHEQAIALAERAQRLDPLAPAIHTGAGAVYYHARDYPRAAAAHLHALALDSTYSVARYMLAEAHLAAGRPEDALRELRQVSPGTVPSGDRMAALAGYAYAMLGRRDDAIRTVENAKRGGVSPVVIATLHAGMGERDSAFAWLDRAVAERDPAIVEFRHEPLLDPLRPDPRFARLAARIGLP